MAVPPGNKQVGNIELAVAYGIKELAVITTTYGVLATAIVTDPALNTVPPVAVSNLQVGNVALTLAHTIKPACNNVTLLAASVIAVLSYAPPTSTTVYCMMTVAVVESTDAKPPISTLQNLQIGNVAIAAVHSTTAAEVTLYGLVAIAVLREFHPRKEHTTITIEYGAEAKLNIGDNS